MDLAAHSLKPILLLAHSFPPENVIGALRPGRMARYLPDYGYSAHVITASEQPPEAPPTVHYAPYRRTFIEAIAARIIPVADEGLSWVGTCVEVASKILSKFPIRIVVSTFPPLSVHSAALQLKRRFGLKWVADFRDPLRGSFGRRELIAQPFNAYYERHFFRHADALIANTDATARFWMRRFPEYRDKISVIYNGPDPALQELKAAPIPPREHRVLLHAGSVYRASFTIPFLMSLDDLVTSGRINPDKVRLHFIGEVDGEAALRESAPFRSLAARNVITCVNQRVPVAEVHKTAAEADYLLVLDRESPDGILQLPAKVFEYIQIGRPIVAFTEPGSPVEFVLSQSGIPHVCIYMHDSRQARAEKLLEFLRSPTESAAASETYLTAFGSHNLTGQLAAILDRLT